MIGMLRVSEIFYSIQGESTHAGLPCVFVRLAGCNLRCRWCDTAYAFHGGREMAVAEVMALVEGYPCSLVEVTGGEPLLQPDAVPLMEELLRRGRRVLLETSGSLPIEGVPEGVARIVDVKCPGSGEADSNRWENLERLRQGDEVKFVIGGREDFRWAAEQVRARRLAERGAVLFSPVHGAVAPAELAGWVLDEGLAVRVQIQLHKLLWPDQDRGV
jgi:7-carboxy-7-deazaguanine synthase